MSEAQSWSGSLKNPILFNLHYWHSFTKTLVELEILNVDEKVSTIL